MVRLPIVGKDSGTWGNVLNDFLKVEHNEDGTLKSSGSLAAKADDSTVVHNSSAETITGTKTFSASPVVPTPTSSGHAASKSYVDGAVTASVPDATASSKGAVQLSGDIGGTAASPQVTSTHLSAALPVSQGGTGSTTKNFVDLSSDQGVSGTKTYTGISTYNSTDFTITNPSHRYVQVDSSSTDDHAKGLLLEWGGNMTAGVNYPYGLATTAYQNNSSATFAVSSTGYKKWGWIMAHYQSPASTGETVHQHLNLETAKADWSTVITRLQISFGEDVALVSFPNSNIWFYNDSDVKIGTWSNHAIIRFSTSNDQIEVSGKAWVFKDGQMVKIGTSGFPGAKLHVEATSDTGMLLVRNTNGSGNTSSANVNLETQTTSSKVLFVGLQGDSTKRLAVYADGKQEWGSGSATRDTNLYRSAADTLKTDDSFVVGTTLTVGSLSGVLKASSGTVSAATGGVDYQGIVKTGIAKISGGAQQYGIPSVLFTSQGTTTMNVNEVRYVPMTIVYNVTLTNYLFEITTAPSGAANFRIGIYAANTDMQPTGAPLYDSGSISVASGFTGTKSGSGLSVALTPGMYLVAANVDVSMAVRSLSSGTPMVSASLGATPLIQRVTATQTYGAFPNPGTAWTATNASAGGLQNIVVWQWTE